MVTEEIYTQNILFTAEMKRNQKYIVYEKYRKKFCETHQLNFNQIKICFIKL